jgi:hypothetical protein
MKKIRNNSNVDSEVIIGGDKYFVAAGDVSEQVDDNIASQWKKTHSFLMIEEAAVKTEPKIVEEKVEVEDKKEKKVKKTK